MAPDDLSELTATWPVGQAALGVTDRSATRGVGGDPQWVTRIASVTKLLVAYAALVAWEEGSLDLDEPAGPEGATVRHLLAHAAGYDFDSTRLVGGVGTRRVYSNTGIEAFAHHLEQRTSIPVDVYVREAVLEPLGMTATELRGSPAHGARSCVDDLLRFGRELLAPTLVAAVTLAEARTAQFPDLAGVLPGVGRFAPNPWGLGFELRDAKAPHWTGTTNAPSTFGHFGGSGSFLWVDPAAGLACAVVTDTPFDAWALAAWPPASDAVLARYR